MQVEYDAVEPGEDRVVGHDPDVIHGVGVARERHPIIVVGCGGRIAAGDGEPFVARVDDRALDAALA